MAETTTIRVRRETRDQIRQLAESRGVTTADLVRDLVERAGDDAALAEHAAAYERLREGDADHRRAIEHEDGLWEQADLGAPPQAG